VIVSGDRKDCDGLMAQFPPGYAACDGFKPEMYNAR
jgi:hypothetical protein